MKTIIMTIVFLIARLYLFGNTFYVSYDYIKYLENGGLPSKYDNKYIVLEIDSSKMTLKVHRSVEMEFDEFIIKKGKYYYSEDKKMKYIGRIYKNGQIIYQVEGKSKAIKFVNAATYFKKALLFKEAQEVINEVNKICLSGKFDISFWENDSLYEYKDVIIKKSGRVIIKNEDIGNKIIYSFIDCGKYFDAFRLSIMGKMYEFVFSKSAFGKYSLNKAPSKPCENKSIKIGYLIRLP